MARFRIALSAVAGFLMAAAIAPAAQADLLSFTFNPGTIGGSNTNSNNLQQLNLNSVSIVTQNATNQTEVGFATITNFVNSSLTTVIPLGLGGTYQVYLAYTSTVQATSFTSSGPITQFNYTLFADPSNTDVGNINTGLVTDPAHDDILLASGGISSAGGSAGFNGNHGPLFSVQASFNLTPDGALVFPEPDPFYDFVFAAATSSQPGNVKFLAANEVRVSTPINASFEVPEPSTLILFGSALIAFGALSGWKSRRKQQPKLI